MKDLSKPMTKSVTKKDTIQDIAREVGINASSVSRALNPETKDRLTPELVAEVERAAKTLGYVPNKMAHALRSGRSNTIGVLVPDIMNPIFPPIVRGVQDELRKNGYMTMITYTDNDRALAREEVQNLKSQLVDGFINVAAFIQLLKLLRRIAAINVKGVWLCTKHVIPTMMARKKGSIVNFSSIYGLIGNDDLPPYHATKGAVLMMTKTDAICYAPYGIRVNCVNPGSTKTELFLKAAETYVHGYDAYLAMMKEKHPLTLGEPVDVANCVLFLASDEARFVTGVALPVDGGYTAQ